MTKDRAEQLRQSLLEDKQLHQEEELATYEGDLAEMTLEQLEEEAENCCLEVPADNSGPQRVA